LGLCNLPQAMLQIVKCPPVSVAHLHLLLSPRALPLPSSISAHNFSPFLLTISTPHLACPASIPLPYAPWWLPSLAKPGFWVGVTCSCVRTVPDCLATQSCGSARGSEDAARAPAAAGNESCSCQSRHPFGHDAEGWGGCSYCPAFLSVALGSSRSESWGSCRSVPSFPLAASLREASGCGHAHDVGC